MDETTLGMLIGTAAFLGLTHTLAGPDHYVPFIAMSQSGRWSLVKTCAVTLACGVGHVLSSVVLGVIGVALVLPITRLEAFEGARGDLAGWLLLGFGLAYMAWGIRQAIRNRPHAHVHIHADGIVHTHEHVHRREHSHVHDAAKPRSLTPWILFVVFVFGPCEPLIPLLMYPAARLSLWGTALVAVVFGAVTLATMMTIVVAGYFGFTRVAFPKLARFAHAGAGLAIAACGGLVLIGL